MNYPSDGSYSNLKRKIRNIITEPYVNNQMKLNMIWEIVKQI
jgi:hypothetical protein